MLRLFYLNIFYLLRIYYYQFLAKKTKNIHTKKDETRDPKKSNKAFV